MDIVQEGVWRGLEGDGRRLEREVGWGRGSSAGGLCLCSNGSKVSGVV